MRPHARIRKTVEWVGAGASVVLLVAWVGSGWWRYGWWSGLGHKVGVGEGMLRIQNDGLSFRYPEVVRGWSGGLGSWSWRWWGHWHTGQSNWEFALPLWLPLFIVAAATAGLWRHDRAAARRRRSGRCVKCGYDRAGIAAGAVCPECGAAAASQK